MLENVHSEFGDTDEEDIDRNDDFGIGTEDIELKGKEVACKLNMPSTKHLFDDNIFDNGNGINPPDRESKTNDINCIETAIGAGAGSINSSSTKAPIKEPPKSYVFLQRHKKSKSEVEFFL